MNSTERDIDGAVLRLLLEEEGIAAAPSSTIPRHADGPGSVPSFAQQRLYFLHRLDPEGATYHVAMAYRLSGRLVVAALEESVNEIVRRHEVLRTLFETVGDETRLRVAPEVRVALPVIDLGGVPADRRDRALAEEIAEQARRPFDLARGPLLRMRLVRLQEGEHAALLTMHHIVADAWSLAVFFRELCELYPAFAAGRPSALPDLPIQYGDFARWQRDQFERGAMAAQLAYWEGQLAGAARLELPTDFPRPAEATSRGGVHGFWLPEEVTGRLERLARDEHASLFMVLLAVLDVLLHRTTQQDDIVVGTPIAHRNRRELEGLIGFFVNTLVVRTDCSGTPTFRTLLRRVRDAALAAYQNQDVPFEQLVSRLVRERDAGVNPLFQVMFTLEGASQPSFTLPDLTITPLEIASDVAKFDLLVNMVAVGSQLVGGIEYNADLFRPETIARFAGHFARIVEAVAADPDRPISAVPILSPAESDQILVAWNETGSDCPRGRGIHQLFEDQVGPSPEAVAIEFGGRYLTYAGLNARANQLAHHLRRLGVGPGSLVAVFVERSLEMVVGWLGILKAGGAYVPLDVDYPPHRLAFMLDDCRASVLLTQTGLRSRLPAHDLKVVDLEADWPSIARGPADNPAAPSSDEELAYVIYTSGSTGLPKGVAVPHRAVNRLVLETNYVRLDPTDRVGQASNASFDAATFEVWGALLTGARLVGIEADVLLAPESLADCLRRRGITTLFLTTALFNQVARDVPTAFGSLRHLLFGGEAVDPRWVRDVLRHGPPQRLLHVYGPTENTTFSTWHLVRDVPEGATTIPIGGPVSATQVYVLDRHLQPVPVGVTGELYLGGRGLARGYWDRPELTAERFIPHPWDDGKGAVLYKTGDLVRFLPERAIEFLGRSDHQVKIRGFRIEPGEVEAALTHQEGVRQAVVVAREDEPGRRQLVAYLVTEAGRTLDLAALREDLRKRLPDYMIPAHLVPLERLPLTPNGKLDKQALPAPAAAGPAARPAEQAPRDERERLLVETFEATLRRPNIGIHDNYFEMGGDSITAIQLVSRTKRAGWHLTIRDLFANPTVARLAPRIARAEGTTPRGPFRGTVPTTPIQRWFFATHRGDLHHFNQAVLLRGEGRIDEGALRAALREIQRQHDMLRATFRTAGGSIEQVVAGDEFPVWLDVQDLRDRPDETGALEAAADAAHRGFDLARGPLMRAALCRLRRDDRLLLVAHHLVVDGVSWRILLEDLERGYRQHLRGEAIDLGPKTDAFPRWAEELHRLALDPAVRGDRDYWSAVLDSAPDLPRDGDGPDVLLYGDSQTAQVQLSEVDTTRLLTQTHHAHNTEVNDLLLTALGRALTQWHGGDSTLITLEGHGREPLAGEIDLSRTVGWFTCLYPFLLSVPAGDLGTQITRVKQALRDVPHKGLSYGLLTELAPPGSALAAQACRGPRLSFNYLGRFDGGDGEDLLGFAPESSGQPIGPRLARVHDLDVVGLVAGGRLSLSILFHPQRHRRQTVEALLANVRDQLLAVAEHCSRIRRGPTVPDRFTHSNLPMEDFDRILGAL
jgi:amino acid adenylation domain-containing protein/non-ribosomal peptide synthase protein (TIGR01720 family)